MNRGLMITVLLGALAGGLTGAIIPGPPTPLSVALCFAAGAAVERGTYSE